MRPERIREALRAVPFRRLRVVLSDGRSYEIPHPEFALLWLHEFIIVTDVDPEGVPRRKVTIDPMHVTHIEHLPDGSVHGPEGSRNG